MATEAHGKTRKNTHQNAGNTGCIRGGMLAVIIFSLHRHWFARLLERMKPVFLITFNQDALSRKRDFKYSSFDFSPSLGRAPLIETIFSVLFRVLPWPFGFCSGDNLHGNRLVNKVY
jgi:hypothetical protein